MEKKYSFLSFKKNFSWSLISSIIFALSQWLIISILAKFGDLKMIGIYTLGLAITAPIFLFTSMNLRVVLATEKSSNANFSSYVLVRFLFSTLALGLIFFLMITLNFDKETKVIIFLIGLVKFVESLNDICAGKFQQIENLKLMATSKILRSLFSILTISCIMYLFEDLKLALVFQLITWILILIFYDLRIVIKKIKEKIFIGKVSLQTLFSIATISLPLGIAATLDSLNTNMPRYFLSYYMSEESLGIFAAITHLMLIGQTIVTALSQVTIPRFSRYYIDDREQFKKLLYKLFLISSSIGLIGLLIALISGDFLLTLIYSDDFIGYSNIFVLSMVAATIWYLSGILNAAIVATRKFKMQIPIFASALLMTTVSSFLLIPIFGLQGAAISLIIGHSARFLIAIIILKKLLKF